MIRTLIILLLIAGCEEPSIEGCTDENANNYNTKANIDDGSCVYTTMYVDINTNLTPSEITTEIQLAIDSATQVNKRLIIEKNTYIVNAVITIPSNADIDFGESTIMREIGTDEGDMFDMIVNSDIIQGNQNLNLKNLIIDGNVTIDADNKDPVTEDLRFSGLKLSNVSDSRLENITVINTINGEHSQQVNPAGGIFFTNNCVNINCYTLNAYNNNLSGIIIHESQKIRIYGSITSNNLGSGITSNNSDQCEFYNIISFDNGFQTFLHPDSMQHTVPPDTLPHNPFSNISINGENCIVNNVTTYNCTGSGLIIGHDNEESKADYTIVDNVESYYNGNDGITIRYSDYVELSNINLHHNRRNNLLIEYEASHTKINNAKLYGYYDTLGVTEGGYGIMIDGGYGHQINSTDVYDNFYHGIGILNVAGTLSVDVPAGDRIYVGPEVNIYNNGRADEFDDVNGGIQDHLSAGIFINHSHNVTIDCPYIYCSETDVNINSNTVKSQDYGIYVVDQGNGGNHVISATFNDLITFELDDIYLNNSINTFIDCGLKGWGSTTSTGCPDPCE